MISRWSDWKRFPRMRNENIEAPISPGIYEVRVAATQSTFAFGITDNVAETLAGLPLRPRSLRDWLWRRQPGTLPELEYRTCATATKADAKAAVEGMLARRDSYLHGVA